MFKQLTKQKWQHKNPLIRLQWIDDLPNGNANDKQTLQYLAIEDPAIEVRLSALQKLNDLRFCLQHIEKYPHEQAKQLLIQLLASAADETLDNQQIAQILALFNSPYEQQQLIINCNIFQLAKNILAEINQQQALADIAIKAISTRVKELAIEKISDISQLKTLQKLINHKNIQQQIRNKLKIHKKAEKQQQNIQQQLEKTCHSLETLAKLPCEDHYQIKLDLLVEQWDEIEHTNLKQLFIERYQTALQKCQHTLQAHNEQQAKHQTIENNKQIQRSICDQLEKHIEKLKADANNYNQAETEKLLNQSQQQWEQSQQIIAPLSIYQRIYKQSSQQIAGYVNANSNLSQVAEQLHQEMIDNFTDLPLNILKSYISDKQDAIDNIHWPKNFSKPQNLQLMQDNLQQAKDLLINFIKIQTEKRNYIDKKTALLKNEISNRNLLAANKLYGHIKKQIEQLNQHFRTTEHEKLQPIADSLQELNDWNEFATSPKKLLLCEKMEKLVEHPLTPGEQAKAVKNIQTEWKQLLSSRFENSANFDENEKLWQRFKVASNKAFEPCLTFYAEKDKQRANNLKQCMDICDMLEDFNTKTDWQKVDWKEVAKIDKTARQEWKNYFSVPASEKQAIYHRFKQIINQIREKLDEERNNNLLARKDLVNKAIQLDSLEQIETAIEKIKRLQQQWKQTGITFFKADREQWGLFKQACDNIFAKRAAQNQQQKQQLQLQLDEINQLLAEIRQLTEHPHDQLLQSHKNFINFKTLIEQKITDLPEHKQKASKNNLQKSCERYESAILQAQQKKSQAVQAAIEQAVELCIQIENTLFQPGSADSQQLQQSFKQIDLIPENIKKHLQLRIAAATQINPESNDTPQKEFIAQSKNNQQALESLAIQLEILCGIESPAGYKNARMQYQLDCLQKGQQLPRTNSEKYNKINNLIETWYAVGGVEPAIRKKLESRLALIKSAIKD